MDAQVNTEADLSAPESDQSDRIKPWTIKGIPIEIRNAAIAAADRDGLPLGKWFERNIPAVIQQNRQQTRVAVVVDQAVIPSDPKADLEEIKGVIAIARDLREVTGDPMPEDVRKLGYDLVRGRLKALKRGGRTRRGRKSDAMVGGSMTRSEMQAAIGYRIRLAREAIEPDRAAFARMLPVDPATLRRIEDGETAPSVFLVMELARRLRVSPNHIILGHD